MMKWSLRQGHYHWSYLSPKSCLLHEKLEFAHYTIFWNVVFYLKKKSSLCNPFSYLHKRSRNIHILKRQLVIIGIHSFWKLNFLFFLKCNTKKKMRRMQNIKIILKDNIMAELDYHLQLSFLLLHYLYFTVGD